MFCGRIPQIWWRLNSTTPDIMRGYYRPWPRVRIELKSGGYIEISYDFILNGPRKQVNKILTVAKKNGGWKLKFEQQEAQNEH